MPATTAGLPSSSLPPPPRAVLYARINEDAVGDAVGVGRQPDDAGELAASRGCVVVDQISDDDISALRGKARPGYKPVLELVCTGQVDHVVVWQTARLLRSRCERAAI